LTWIGAYLAEAAVCGDYLQLGENHKEGEKLFLYPRTLVPNQDRERGIKSKHTIKTLTQEKGALTLYIKIITKFVTTNVVPQLLRIQRGSSSK
jgi:hypothetical protein